MKSDKGGVLVEFLTSIPLLFILFYGLTNVGRFLGIATGIGNAAYNVALVGTETPRFSAAGAMAYRRDTIYSKMHEKKDIGMLASANPVYDNGRGTVSVTMTGTLTNPLNSIFFALGDTNQGLMVTAPVLGIIEAVTDGTPQNQAGTYYNCQHQTQSWPNDTNCSYVAPPIPPQPPYNGGGGGGSSGGGTPCPATGAATGQPTFAKAYYGIVDESSITGETYVDSPCDNGGIN